MHYLCQQVIQITQYTPTTLIGEAKMYIPEITEKLLAAKKAKQLTFLDLEKALGDDEVWIASVMYRQASASPEKAKLLIETLGLDVSYAQALTECPIRGLGPVVPTDPFIYRFYEVMQIYGLPLKEVIQEKLGDGIINTTNCSLDVENDGRFVKVIMSGQFIPYRKW